MKQNLSPWKWVPTLYFAEGLPYVAVMVLSLVMYKRMGISNTEVALYTSWLNLPWVIKPLWSPFVDLLKTKRWWIVSMQLLIGAGLEIDIIAGHALIAGNGVRQNDFIGIADMGLGRRIGNGCGYIIRFLFHGKFLLYRNAYLLPIILNNPP